MHALRTLFAVTLLLLVCRFAAAQIENELEENYIGDLFFAELEWLTGKIANKWPPDNYVYVGIGRSPAPVIASLQNRFENCEALNLPLSDFRVIERSGKTGKVRVTKVLSEYEKNRLFRHFDKFLDDIPAEKKILLMDYALSGDSILSSTYYFHLYMKQKYPERQQPLLEAVAFGDSLTWPEEVVPCGIYLAQSIPCQYLQERRFFTSEPLHEDFENLKENFVNTLRWKQCKWMAEYPKYPFLKVGCPEIQPGINRNPLYDQFREHLKVRKTQVIPKSYRPQWTLFGPAPAPTPGPGPGPDQLSKPL